MGMDCNSNTMVMVSCLPPLPQAQVLCMSLAAPNQEVAFVLAAGYTAISALTAGMVVSIPNMNPAGSFLNYISMMKCE